jgi:arylsulfatase A-like enzyme
LLACATGLAALTGCGGASPDGRQQAAAPRPNVLWILWDTVRADHLTVYGHKVPTTPFLEEFAKNARVFEDCLAVSCHTLPTHASMFTGLLPPEHGVHNTQKFLDEKFHTVAELLGKSGYQTYCWAANPHIVRGNQFTQGFDVEAHPWDPQYLERAKRITTDKVPENDDSAREFRERVQQQMLGPWQVKASGEIAQESLETWIDGRDAKRPYFAFLNYMEAHRPFLPWPKSRAQVMNPADVKRSYEVDRSWLAMWSYVFRLREYSEEELRIMSLTYDACIAELDGHLRNMIASLEKRGALQNTIVIITADHGEMLGEQHMLDHQYALYQPLLHVPLIVHYPSHFAAGRDPRPVSHFDIFPTLLELAGVKGPPGCESRAVSLLRPLEQRVRIADYPTPLADPFKSVARRYPGFDGAPWNRGLLAYVEPPYKLIRGSDGRNELYQLTADPAEAHDLSASTPEQLLRMNAGLDAYLHQLCKHGETSRVPRTISAEERRRLGQLGYVDIGDDDEDHERSKSDRPGSAPSSAPTSAPAGAPSSAPSRAPANP